MTMMGYQISEGNIKISRLSLIGNPSFPNAGQAEMVSDGDLIRLALINLKNKQEEKNA